VVYASSFHPLKTSPFKLIALDIEGEWNRPLLANAATLAGCDCLFARTSFPKDERVDTADAFSLEAALRGCSRILACETTRNSVSIYDFPVPKQTTAVIVGNEETGIPRPVLKKADEIVSIPMAPCGLSSVNVAVAAAIALYAFTRDLGRKRWARSELGQRDSDILIEAQADPHEVGSLLRSVYAFGWRRAFVSDPHGVWFTDDSRTLLESRSAARRAKNPLVVLPASQLDPLNYDGMLVCDGSHEGVPLSRLRLPECKRLLIVIGGLGQKLSEHIPAIQVNVDHPNSAVVARFRHYGSILLSVSSHLLTR
jgi:tRNA G18 (ribose-2'-O)-methylase SpoU